MRLLLTSLLLTLLSLPSLATNYTVKSSGGDFATMAACASQMTTNGTGVSDTCTVFAGTYGENVTIPAGSVGNYKIFNVNGSDVVSVLSFTLNSHNKLIGNCPTKQGTVTTATCGFFIANPSSPGAKPCVTTSTTATDVYIYHNVMYACANGIGNSGSTSGAAISLPATGSFIYVQGNTCSYPAATVASPVFTGKCIDAGEPNTSGTSVVQNLLVEDNDFSHYTLGVKFSTQHSIFRNNWFHDQLETEGSSNMHTDIFFSEQLFNVIYNVIEGNFERNAVGPNAKGVLAQGDTPCSGCTNLIVRYDVTSRIGSGVSSNYPTWPYIKNYNNTHVDLNMDASCANQDTDLNYLVPNASLLNQVYYYNTPCNWTNWNSGSCLASSCTYGHNLYFCVGSGCASPYNHSNGGPSLWLTDPGNLHADPKFVNYVSPGSTSNDYHLQAGSPAIAAGTYLTTVASGDSGSGTSLVVSDASYFQDGYSLTNANSTVYPDCISITTVGNHVCITSINYATNTLTMASGFSRSVGDHVWLYSKSDGVQVLTGSAPDMGAFPFNTAATIIYNARTDVVAQPYPGTIPCPSSLGCAGGGALNGAGFSLTPSDFATPLIRITDLAVGGQSSVHDGYTTSCDASSEENRFNVNKDRFMICQDGNWQQLWSLNIAAKTAARDTSFVSPGSGSTTFSYVQPYAYYHTHLCPASTAGCTQNDPAVFSYDATCAGGIATCTPPATTVVDIATACSLAPLQANTNAAGGVSASADDQTFGGGFSSTVGQGSSGDIYVVAWTRAGNCYYWNTNTGQTFVNGTLQGTITAPDRFTLHNVKMGKGGTWMKVSESSCVSSCTAGQTNLFWQIGTTNVTVATSVNSCGHTAIGYNSWVNKCSGAFNANGLFKSTMLLPNTNVSLPSVYPVVTGSGDQAHINWTDDNATDTNPFQTSFEASAFAPVYAWDNELLGVATDGSGLVWRFAHTYVSQINAQAFVPIATSQDGSLLLWTTDWDQLLGCSDGVSLGCGLINPDWATGTVYTTTSTITPLVGNTGVNAIGYSYQPTAGCTSGGSEPATWNQTVGGTSSDGACTWTNRGLARTDVFLAQLQYIITLPSAVFLTQNPLTIQERGTK